MKKTWNIIIAIVLVIVVFVAGVLFSNPVESFIGLHADVITSSYGQTIVSSACIDPNPVLNVHGPNIRWTGSNWNSSAWWGNGPTSVHSGTLTDNLNNANTTNVSFTISRNGTVTGSSIGNIGNANLWWHNAAPTPVPTTVNVTGCVKLDGTAYLQVGGSYLEGPLGLSNASGGNVITGNLADLDKLTSNQTYHLSLPL